MRKEKKFTESEYTLNPLYRKMKERFSVEGQVTIGDFMRNRARRDGYTVRGYEMPAAPVVAVAAPEKVPATPLRTPALESAPACKKKDSHPSFFKRHVTFFAYWRSETFRRGGFGDGAGSHSESGAGNASFFLRKRHERFQ